MTLKRAHIHGKRYEYKLGFTTCNKCYKDMVNFIYMQKRFEEQVQVAFLPVFNTVIFQQKNQKMQKKIMISKKWIPVISFICPTTGKKPQNDYQSELGTILKIYQQLKSHRCRECQEMAHRNYSKCLRIWEKYKVDKGYVLFTDTTEKSIPPSFYVLPFFSNIILIHWF